MKWKIKSLIPVITAGFMMVGMMSIHVFATQGNGNSSTNEISMEGDGQEQAAAYNAKAAGTSFAVYGTNSSGEHCLNFYKRTSVPAINSSFDGLTVKAVYTGFETAEYGLEYDWDTWMEYATTPWNEVASVIQKVKVVDEEIVPMSTSYWFYGFENTVEFNMGKLDVSQVTDMSFMFYYGGNFADTLTFVGLNDWDVSNVEDMSCMFGVTGMYVQSYDLDLSGWDVSSVTHMDEMFSLAGNGAGTFHLDLSNWDLSSVVSLSSLFSESGMYATSWSVDGLDTWDTSNVEDMSWMFYSVGYNVPVFELDLSTFDTSNVTDMSLMFNSVGYYSASCKIIGINKWDVSNVTNMTSMFYGTAYEAPTFELNISNWDVTNVTVMDSMFAECAPEAKFKLNLSKWNPTNLESCSFMFNACGASVINIAQLNNSANFAESMFDNCLYLEEVTVGGNFVFGEYYNSDWDFTMYNYLPTPSNEYINGATGVWYNKNTKQSYSPSAIPTKTAATYVAVLKTPFAIYSEDDNSLRFYKRSNVPSVGDTIEATNPDGSKKYITIKYLWDDRIETRSGHSYTSIPWYSNSIARTGITTVYMEDVITPTSSTAYWFYDLENCSYLNLNNLDVSNVTNMHGMFNGTGEKVNDITVIGLSNWNTSNVTDMVGMFGCFGQNATIWSVGDLSNWDTSNVTNMSSMFWCTGENIINWSIDGLSNWDTSNVTDMSSMFVCAGMYSTTLNLDLSNWDVSNVTNMRSVFSSIGYNVTNWSVGDLSNWDTSNVTDMNNMFSSAGSSDTSLDLSYISNWDVSSVTDMHGMFSSAGYKTTNFVLNLSDWDVSNVTNMNYMFNSIGMYGTTLNLDLSNWNVSSVTDMHGMFGYNNDLPTITSFNLIGLSNWDVSNVTNMRNMFYRIGYNAETINLDLSNWDVSSVTDMQGMFGYVGYLNDAFSIGDISNWDVSSVTDMSSMFDAIRVKPDYVLDLSGWDASSVTNMEEMLYNNVETIKTPKNISTSVRTVNILHPLAIYYDATDNYKKITKDNFPVGNGEVSHILVSELPDTSFAVYSETDNSLRFYKRKTVPSVGDTIEATNPDGTKKNVTITSIYTNVENITTIPWSAYRNAITTVYVEEVITPSSSTAYWFYYLRNCSYLNVEKLDVSNVIDMKYMFREAGRLSDDFVIIGLSNWDTSNVMDMSWMFFQAGYNDINWSIGDISNWEVGNVTSMESMFWSAGNKSVEFILDLSEWNVSSVTNMSCMFEGAGYYSTIFDLGNLENWDVSNVEYMSSMFWAAGSQNAITWNIGDISKWKVSSVKNMCGMFAGAGGFDESFNIGDLSEWDTSNVTDMSSMFSNFGYSTFDIGDISNWDVSNVTDMSYMFEGTGYSSIMDLEIDLSGWDVPNVTDISGMFYYTSADIIKTPKNINSEVIKDDILSGVYYDETDGYKEVGSENFPVGNGEVSHTLISRLPLTGTAFAIYSKDDNSLRLYNNREIPSIGDTIEATNSDGSKKNITVTAVWEGIENMVATEDNSQNVIPWSNSYLITEVYVEDIVTPTSSTAFWFSGLGNCSYMNLEKLDVSNVADMSGMFSYAGYDASVFELDLSGWDTSSVENMSGMFYGAGYESSILELNLSGWDASSVINMEDMFNEVGYNSTSFKLDLSGWDASNVISMSGMFCSAGYNSSSFELDLSGWDTPSVENMSYMFSDSGCCATSFELDLSGWNTSNVTNMSGMFCGTGYESSTFELNLSGWDTSNVEDMSGMFAYAGYSATDFVLDLSTWNAVSVYTMEGMFYEVGAHTIKTPKNIDSEVMKDDILAEVYYDQTDDHKEITLENFPVGNGEVSHTLAMIRYDFVVFSETDNSLRFYKRKNLPSIDDTIDATNPDGSKKSITVTDILEGVEDIVATYDDYETMIPWCDSDGIETVYVEDVITPTSSTAFWFVGLTNCSYMNLEKLDVSNVTDMIGMFSGSGYSASTFELDLSGWDTSNVMSMEGMFNCAGYSASNFELDLSEWDTSSVENMSGMFYNAGYNASTFSIEGLSNWDVSAVINMCEMFCETGCNASSFELDLSGWDASEVQDMSGMFSSTGYNASSFELDLSGWDISSVENMSGMFYNAGYNSSIWLIEGLSNLEVSSVMFMDGMFFGAGYNAVSFELDLSGWETTNAEDLCYMFSESGIKKLNISGFDTSNAYSEEMFSNMIYLEEVIVGDKISFGELYHEEWDYIYYNNLPTPSDEYIDGAKGVWFNKETGKAYFSDEIPNNTAATYVAVKEGPSAFAVYGINGNEHYLKFYKRDNIPSVGDTFEGMIIQEVYTDFEFNKIEDVIDVPWYSIKQSITDVEVVDEGISPMSTNSWFYGMSNCNTFEVSKLNTSSVTDMSYMFANAGWYAPTFELDLSEWDVSSVINMHEMFYGSGDSSQIWSIGDVSNWDTSNVEDMSYMFAYTGRSATPYELDLSGWDTSKVKEIGHMFDNSGIKKLNISGFDISNAYCDRIFDNMKYLQEISVSDKVPFGSIYNPAFQSSYESYLPTPDPEYIPRATGKWYNNVTWDEFEPNAIPNNTAATYVAVKPGYKYNYIYIGGEYANDNNNGYTPETAIATLEKAYDELSKNIGGTIYVVGNIDITDNTTLDKTYYENNATGIKIDIPEGYEVSIKRYSQPTDYASLNGFNVTSNLGYLMTVSSSKILTLEDIIIDGHRDPVTTGEDREIAPGVEATNALIRNNSTLNINNATLRNNISTGSGGAIYANGKINIAGGEICNNTVKSSGGAICLNSSAILTISGGEIHDNTATSGGGAIYAYNTNITSGKIYNNSGVYGGAIYTPSSGSLTISGGEIYGNTSSNGGGAIYSISNNGSTISGGEIHDNTATSNGGGIFIGGKATVTGGKIYNNNSKNGSGIYSAAQSALTLSGGEIHDNTATSNGGGVDIYGELIVNNGKIYNNNANYGGGICVESGSNLTLSNGEIYNNTATSSGGAIRINGAATVEGGDIVHNTAKYGGGINVNTSGVLTLSGGTIAENTGTSGGGIYANGSINATGGAIRKNEATSGAGIFINKDANISNTEISENIATSNGGGIYVYSSGELTISEGHVYENNAKFGGGICVYSGGSLTLLDSEIHGNTATASGGGIYTDDSVEIIRGEIYENTAASGGGIFVNADVTVSDAMIHNNSAKNGGSIYIYSSGNLTLSGGEIFGNDANINGSAIYLSGALRLKNNPEIDNDIYVLTNYKVIVEGELSNTLPITLTPDEYLENKICVEVDYTDASGNPALASDVIDKFNLTPNNMWVLAAGDMIDDNENVDDNVIILKESIEYVIGYEGNGSTNGVMEESVHQYYVENVLNKNTYTKDGYLFAGWNTEPDGSGLDFSDEEKVYNLTSIDGDYIVLYAQWTTEPDITYIVEHWWQNPNGNTESYDEENYTLISSEKLTGENGEEVTPAVNIYDGYISPEPQTIILDFDNEYIIKYYYEKLTEKEELMPILMKEGYEFVGWYDNPEFDGNKISNLNILVDTKDYYDKWVKNAVNYTVKHWILKEEGNKDEFDSNNYELKGIELLYGPAEMYMPSKAYNDAMHEVLLDSNIFVGADGLSVINYYYEINEYAYSIVYKTESGIILGTSSVECLGGVESIVEAKVFNGYNKPFARKVVGGNEIEQIVFIYKPLEYKVTIDCAGGSGVTGTTYTIETETFALGQPEREGYTFAGWTGSNGDTPEINISIAKGTTGNKNYTANWSENSYTATFDSNGGTTANPETIVRNYNDSLGALPETSREGYTFNGWYTMPDGGTQITSDTKVTSDVTYYAQWAVNEYTYNIVYKSNSDVELETGTAKYAYGTTNEIIAKDFNGYTKPANQTVVWDDVNAKTITFVYTPIEYTVTIDCAGGLGVTETTYTVETETFTLDQPEREGYTFAGWTGSNGDTPETNVSIAKGSIGDKSYVANWSIVDYEIIYELDGGINPENASISYNYETTITLPVPTKTGYVFEGWYETQGFDGDVITEIEAGKNTGNKTFYAKWEIADIEVIYDANGGYFEMPLEPGLYDENDNLLISWDDLTSTEYCSLSNDCCIENQPILSVDGDGVLTGAFDECSWENLSAEHLNGKLIVAEGVKSIRYGAFYLCEGLTSVKLPNSLTRIEADAFEECTSLESISIPDGVERIDDYAFYGSGVTSVVISDSVTYIGESVFEDCSNIETIEVSTNNKFYDSRNNCNAIIETATNTLIQGCKNTIIPDTVTAIGNCAFSNCSGLISIAVPNSVTSLGDYVFFNCENLTNIEIPNNIEYIGECAFSWCENLEDINLPSSLMTIEEGVLMGCSKIVSIDIPDKVTNIGDSAFMSCSNLTHITIPEGVIEIGQDAFIETNLINLTIPNSVERIGKQAFSSCYNLSNITMGNGLKIIDRFAFTWCSSITNITMPSSMEYIGDSSFAGCSSLTSVIFMDPYSWYIGDYYGEEAPAALNSSALSNAATAATYLKTTYGYYYWEKKTLEPGLYDANGNLITPWQTLVTNGDITMDGTLITGSGGNLNGQLIIPNTVTGIDEYAFSYCTGLTYVEIPNSVTSIEMGTFYGCSSLVTIKIPNSVTTIKTETFSYCDGLASIIIPSSVTNIDLWTFDCFGLMSATFEDPEGWYTGSSAGSTTTKLSSTDLSDPSTAANYLTIQYLGSYWTKQ